MIAWSKTSYYITVRPPKVPTYIPLWWVAIFRVFDINQNVSLAVTFGLDRHKAFHQRSAQALCRLHFDVERNQVQTPGA